MSRRLLVCDLQTGWVVAAAPFEVSGGVSRVLQGFGSGTLALPVTDPKCPANWYELITPWRVLIIAVDGQGRITWGGVPQRRLEPLGGSRVSYPTKTLEAYLLERYVPDMHFAGADQTGIARHLAEVCGDPVGLPLQYDCPHSGVLRDQDYAADEKITVYDALQDLAAQERGFNWTIDLSWADDTQRRVVYTFRTGYPYLGTRTAHPEHVFSYPGNVSAGDLEESWEGDDAGTDYTVSGAGDGENKPVSDHVIDHAREAAGTPRLERRYEDTTLSDKGSLNAAAAGRAARGFGGLDLSTLTVKNGVGTSLGDLAVGDTARVVLTRHGKTYNALRVVVGWEELPATDEYRPTLAEIEGSR